MEANPKRENRESKIYPLLSLLCSILIFVGALLTAKEDGWIFLSAVVVIFLLFGMWRKLLFIIPFIVVFGGIYFGLAYLLEPDLANALSGVWRIGGLCLAIVPSLYLYPEDLIRSLNAMHFPRMASLGLLITLRFFPLLNSERKRIKEAMRSRAMPFSLKGFYRSTIIPFAVRLVHLSDALSLSIETKGFSKENKNVTSFRSVPFYVKDALFFVLITASFVCSLIFCPGVNLL